VDERRAARDHDARTFGAGAACGFLAGALAVWFLFWTFGGMAGLRTGRQAQSSAAAVPTEPWGGAAHEEAGGVLQPADNTPAATTGTGVPAGIPPVEGLPAGTAGGDVAGLRGRNLEMPVEGVDRAQLTRQFTDLRGGNREHEALDILAPRNTPVQAVEDGTVAKLFLSKAGGNTIYQFDPSGLYCYYYAHLERYAEGLHEGQAVRRGQVIGYVGTSGNAPENTPHLHFAIFRLTPEKHWWEGTAIDPYDVLR
jgi:murein DD-endopeptidase MepM/ murein hydrolase activator NlpD